MVNDTIMIDINVGSQIRLPLILPPAHAIGNIYPDVHILVLEFIVRHSKYTKYHDIL